MSCFKAFFGICLTVLLFTFNAQAFEFPKLEIPDRPTHEPQWKLNFPDAASPVKHIINDFHMEMLYIITAITIFVLILLIVVCIRFNKKANPIASKTTHNTLIEIIWTTVPILILVFLAVPSFKLLYFMDRSPDQTVEKAAVAAGEDAKVYDEMTIKVIGYQWYWGYSYPDHGGFSFDSNMLEDNQLTKERPYRLLEVDNRLVLPVDTNIRILLTASDVIHAFGVASLGLKTDAVPGKLNETWVRIEKPGVYYGQCSELCGIRHGFMPIAIEAVSKDAFQKWVEDAKKKYAANGEVKAVAMDN